MSDAICCPWRCSLCGRSPDRVYLSLAPSRDSGAPVPYACCNDCDYPFVDNRGAVWSDEVPTFRAWTAWLLAQPLDDAELPRLALYWWGNRGVPVPGVGTGGYVAAPRP